MMATSASACFVRAMRAVLLLSFYQNAVSQLGSREEECNARTYRHQGYDNGWMDLIEQPPASDASDCCQICTNDLECEAFQWSYSVSKCSLFNTSFVFDDERYDEDFLTGTGAEPSPAPTFMPAPIATCNAHTYRHQTEVLHDWSPGQYPTRDAGECCADCRKYEFTEPFTTNCTSFLWRSSDSACWLFSEPFIFTSENFHEGYIGGNINASEHPFVIENVIEPSGGSNGGDVGVTVESGTSDSSLLIIIGGVLGGVVVLCACGISCYFFAQSAIDKRVRHVQRQEVAAAARANLVLQNGQAPAAAAARANVVLQNGQAPPVVAYEHKDGVVHVHHYHNESVPNAPPVHAEGPHVPHEGEAIRQPPLANDHITPANAPEEPAPDIEEDFAAPIKPFADASVQLDNIPPPAYSED